MTPKEKAIKLWNANKVFYWHEVDGYIQDDEKTLNTCLNVVNELLDEAYMNNNHQRISYYFEVRGELKAL